MRILLDEHYMGLKESLKAMGWEVMTVQDAKLKGSLDREVIEYAREKDLLVVTEVNKPAQIADMLGVKYIWISPGVVAKTIDAEIREKYAEN